MNIFDKLRITGRSVQPSAKHRALKADIDKLLQKHEALPPLEILAIASQVVGMIIAHQDAKAVSPAMATQVVGTNIEIGNAAALALLVESEPAGHG